jgi:hypothetical protein
MYLVLKSNSFQRMARRELTAHVEDNVLHDCLALALGPLLLVIDPPRDPVPQIAGVGEVDGRVHAEHEHAGHRLRRGVLVHPPVDHGVGDVAEHRGPRPRDEQHDAQHGYGDGDDQADLDAAEDDAEVGADADAEVGLVHLPQVDGGRVVDQAQHRRHDDRREHHQRRVVEQRCQEQQRDHHRHRHDHVRHGRLATGIDVHGGPRKRACQGSNGLLSNLRTGGIPSDGDCSSKH